MKGLARLADARARVPVFFIAALFLGVCVGAGVMLGPVRSRARQLDEQILAQEKKAARNLRILSATSKEAAVRDYEKFGGIMAMRGSSAEESAAMLSEIQKLASDDRVVISSTKPREASAPDKDYEVYQVQIDVETGLPQLFSFIYGLEMSSQLLRVEKLAIAYHGEDDKNPLHGNLVISKMVTR